VPAREVLKVGVIVLRVELTFTDGLNTKGTRAHMHRELIRE